MLTNSRDKTVEKPRLGAKTNSASHPDSISERPLLCRPVGLGPCHHVTHPRRPWQTVCASRGRCVAVSQNGFSEESAPALPIEAFRCLMWAGL